MFKYARKSSTDIVMTSSLLTLYTIITLTGNFMVDFE